MEKNEVTPKWKDLPMNFKQNQPKGKIRKAHASVKHVIMSSTRGTGVKSNFNQYGCQRWVFLITESLWFKRASEITLDTL